MSAAAHLTITHQQLDQLQDALDCFENGIYAKGEVLADNGAVQRITWEDDNSFTAKVCGTKFYNVLLTFGPLGCEAECSCPYAVDCKHAAAVIFEIIDHASVTKQPTKTKKPQVKQAPAEIPPPPAGTLAALVHHKLGTQLDSLTRRCLDLAEPLWQQQKSTVATPILYEMCGRTQSWGMGQVRLWPDTLPPQNEWEFLACLIEAMQKNSLNPSAQLMAAVDPVLQTQLLARWRRQDDIDRWRNALAAWKDPATEAAVEAAELRLLLHPVGAQVQVRQPGQAEFAKASQKLLKQLWGTSTYTEPQNHLSAGSNIVLKTCMGEYGRLEAVDISPLHKNLTRSLTLLLSSAELRQTHVVNDAGETLEFADEPLRWDLQAPTKADGDYELRLLNHLGIAPPPPLAILPGAPLRYITRDLIYTLAYWPAELGHAKWPVRIPAAALETRQGVAALAKLGVATPPRLAGRVTILRPAIVLQGKLHRQANVSSEYLHVAVQASFGSNQLRLDWNGTSWFELPQSRRLSANDSQVLLQHDRSTLPIVGAWLSQWPLRQFSTYPQTQLWLEQRIQGKDWPELFLAWLDRRPKGLTVELDAELASLRDGKVAGHVRLDIEESKNGIDWFDLSVALDVNDSTLSQAEIDLLLKAKGKWVRLPGKGWRKLEYQLSEEQLQELAELGLAAHDFSADKQRLHALQLGGLAQKKTTLLSAERVEQVRRRVEEIQTRVTPPLPDGITATLRPYQTDGFHFLAYLTANRFGGVLADDMGLGKTLQTLVWIAWLRGEQQVREPMLVICPKSVQDNWRGEVARFFPQLTVEVWSRASAGKTGMGGEVDLLIIHYAQLRIHEDLLKEVEWGAVILDEAQAIKNPTSQNSQAACGLSARHRLALTGTPIENRLLDLWSIFAFAMPGVLGTRAAFTKNFDGKEDPLARRRLAARTRPFLLRRTKNEVARDLPDRVEEDLSIELEGTQAALYQAEVKRARAQLLKVETSKQLDKLRFNILTSLLRLRQICCHPRLLGLDASAAKKGRKKAAEPAAESAKVAALLELLEPLMEEGQKVLVFSQFVEMLAIIEAEIQERGWHSFKLTGQTEERGALVNEFQTHEGAATFLISLKAGGFGLNLTAASYVVLFDPWWNPAVEAQAIDRTHRIGQKQTVFAYRLIVKNSIEEKIRQLQKQKGNLANDILGEENFAQALTLNDFQFLLGGDTPD